MKSCDSLGNRTGELFNQTGSERASGRAAEDMQIFVFVSNTRIPKLAAAKPQEM